MVAIGASAAMLAAGVTTEDFSRLCGLAVAVFYSGSQASAVGGVRDLL